MDRGLIMNFKKVITIFLTIFTISFIANAEESNEHRHHEAHVHGEAELSLIIDETSIAFELKSPALNVLGFEHEPKTEAEEELVHAANEKLSKYENIIFIPDLKCKVSEFDLDSPYEDEHAGESHHDAHDHEEDHGDYYLSYSLSCKNIDKLETIEVKLFENFEGFESIEAMWINQSEADSAELTKERNIIKLK